MHPAEAIFAWTIVLSPIWGGVLLYMLHRAGKQEKKKLKQELARQALVGALSSPFEHGNAAFLAAEQKKAIEAYLAAARKKES